VVQQMNTRVMNRQITTTEKNVNVMYQIILAADC